MAAAPVIPTYAPTYQPDTNTGVSVKGIPFFDQTFKSVKEIGGALDYAFQTFYIIIGIVAVIYLIWSGIRYISANGNKDALTQARQGIVYAVLGIVIIMTSYAIISVIAYLSNTLR